MKESQLLVKKTRRQLCAFVSS